jgi:hypothetical protein
MSNRHPEGAPGLAGKGIIDLLLPTQSNPARTSKEQPA